MLFTDLSHSSLFEGLDYRDYSMFDVAWGHYCNMQSCLFDVFVCFWLISNFVQLPDIFRQGLSAACLAASAFPCHRRIVLGWKRAGSAVGQRRFVSCRWFNASVQKLITYHAFWHYRGKCRRCFLMLALSSRPPPLQSFLFYSSFFTTYYSSGLTWY